MRRYISHLLYLLLKKFGLKLVGRHAKLVFSLVIARFGLRTESIHQVQYDNARDEIHCESGEIHTLVKATPAYFVFRVIECLHSYD